MDLVTIVISVFCAIISSGILFKYFSGKISLFESLIIATAFKYYTIKFIGPTIDVLFVVSYIISIYLLLSTKYLHRKIIQLAILFSISFITFIFCFLIADTGLVGLRLTTILKNDFVAVIKYILPLLVITNKLLISGVNYEEVKTTFKKVGVFSCIVALFQMCLFIGISNNTIREILGLTGGDKYMFELGPLSMVRLQAFCYEPKGLSALLGICISLFLTDKQYRKALLCFLVGLLTLSQTFFLVLFAYLFIRVVSFFTKRLAIVVLSAIAMFFLVFNIVNLTFDKLVNANTDSAIAKIVLNRALERFDMSLKEDNNDLFGFPLQRDLELPAVNFFKDRPFMLISGFGYGNYPSVPLKYFVSDWNISLLERNLFKGHFDMGWIFLVAEFGIIFTLLFFFCFTAGFKLTDDVSYFFAFLLVVFFFHRIDFLFFSSFAMLYYNNVKRNVLQAE